MANKKTLKEKTSKEKTSKEKTSKEQSSKGKTKLAPTVTIAPDESVKNNELVIPSGASGTESSEEGETQLSYKELLQIDKELRKEEEKTLKSRKATEEEKDAVWLARANRSAELKRAKARQKSEAGQNKPTEFMDSIMAFTGIKDGYIEYAGKYFGAAVEIEPMEFRFFSESRRKNSIEAGLGRVLRSVHSGFSANIVKIERPVIYDNYLAKEKIKLEELRKAFESGVMSEDEFKGRVQIVQDRIEELHDYCFDHKIITPYYYLVLFESDKKQLDILMKSAMDTLSAGEMDVHLLDTKELAVFLKYTNQIDFDEREIS